MMKYTVEQLHEAACRSAIYVMPQTDIWLRMQYTEPDSFYATDEGGEDHTFYFAEMVEAGEDPVFYELTRMTIARDLADSNEWIEP